MTFQSPSLREFLGVLFGSDGVQRVHVCMFGADPNLSASRWKGFKLGHRDRLPADENQYFSIADLDLSQGRVLGAVRRHVMIIADDVGTKVAAGSIEYQKLLDVFGLPTFQIETSPGNETWGWRLDLPILSDDTRRGQLLAAVRDVMKNQGLTDPSTADAVRYIRLPWGVNTKEKYRSPVDGSFPLVGLVAWRPDVVVSLEKVAAGLLGGDFWNVALSGVYQTTAQRAVSGAMTYSADLLAPEPIIRLAEEIGLAPRRGTKPGVVDAICPNSSQHTDRGDTGFAFLGRGLMECHHGHCQHLTTADFRDMMLAEYERQVAARVAMGALVEDPFGAGLRDAKSGELVPETGSGFLARETFRGAGLDPAQGVGAGQAQENLLDEAAALSQASAQATGAKYAGLAASLADLNDRYCLVSNINGVVERAPASGALYGVTAFHPFCVFYDGLAQFPTGKGNQTKGLGSTWLSSPQAPRYQSQGLWMPGKAPVDALNLFGGLPARSRRSTAVGPTAGVKPSCVKLLDFILAVICSGDFGLADYVLNWMAWKVQNPLEKPGVNLALVGEQGTGKGTLGKMMLDIFGRKYSLHVTQADHLLGRFTGHLEGVLFVLIDEAMFGKDPRTRGVYKARTTEETILIEHKGQTPRTAINHMAIMILTNEIAGLPVELNDRRATVIEVSDAHKQDTAFFGALWHEWDHGGREAFIATLLARDVSGFDPMQPYETEAKEDMAEATGDPITLWWLDVLAAGNVPGLGLSATGQPIDWTQTGPVILNRDLVESFNLWAREKRVQHLPTRVEIIRRVTQLCPSARPGRNRVDGERERNMKFPKLDETIKAARRALAGSYRGVRAEGERVSKLSEGTKG